MADKNSVRLDADERDTLLGTGGTGVLSLSISGEESPHSIPVSYGYDASAETFYFRLAAGRDSQKGELNGRAVTFVAYQQPEDLWQSVVAQGSLESTTDEDIAIDTLAGLERVSIPFVDIFGKPTADVTFEFYRLEPEELTARKENPTA